MVSPVPRREAVEMVEDRLEISQHRACSTLGQHRSMQRYRPRRRGSDAPLLSAIHRVARAEPRWGYAKSMNAQLADAFDMTGCRLLF